MKPTDGAKQGNGRDDRADEADGLGAWLNTITHNIGHARASAAASKRRPGQ